MELFDEFNEKRAIIGVGSQLNVYDETLKKYVLLLPLETVPSIVGSDNTVDVDVLTSYSIGKIKGKRSIDDKDATFLWHRDNLRRIEEIADGQQHDFLISYPDKTGWKFTAEITYRPDDASSDKLTGTLTIIASEVDETATMNVLDLMARTCTITSVVPSHITLAKTSGSQKISVIASTSGATISAKSDTSTITASASGKDVTISTTSSSEVNGIVSITASAEGQASWTTTILVEVA